MEGESDSTTERGRTQTSGRWNSDPHLRWGTGRNLHERRRQQSGTAGRQRIRPQNDDCHGCDGELAHWNDED